MLHERKRISASTELTMEERKRGRRKVRAGQRDVGRGKIKEYPRKFARGVGRQGMIREGARTDPLGVTEELVQ